jgi:putative Mn2+ efflux pump MntP
MGGQVWVMAFLFGLFQALMPLVGWKAFSLFSTYISTFDHWIAFGLLSVLGIKMIIDGCHSSKDDKVLNPSHPLVLLTLSVATSIDAMAVGVSFVGMGLLDFSDIIEAIVVIGIVSFLFSVCGKYIGVRLGQHFNWPVEILGGIILIGIGIKVLCEHLIV